MMKKKDENTILSSQVKDLKLSAERSNKENRLLETRFNRLQGKEATYWRARKLKHIICVTYYLRCIF